MRLFLISLAIMTCLPAAAQGAFLAPMGDISEIDGVVSVGAGAGAGIIMHRWLVGAYGIYTSKAGHAGENGNTYDLNLTFGGVWLGYAQPASEYLAVTIAFKGAMGSARQKGITEADQQNDRFWLLTPEAGVEVALGKSVRLNLSAGYRIPGNIELSAFTNKNLQSLVNTLSIKIGNLGKVR